MNNTQKIFAKLLNGKDGDSLEDVSSGFLPDLYIYSALLGTVSTFIKEQHWIKGKEGHEVSHYKPFLRDLFDEDIPTLSFLVDDLSSTLEDHGLSFLKKIQKRSNLIETIILNRVGDFSSDDKANFLRVSLGIMTELFLWEESLQEGRELSDGHRGPCLYRTFDGLDEIFELDYQQDREMEVNKVAKERLYEGAGVGVQSGYSTILLAIEAMKAKTGAMAVDLGSGYGRVGLVYCLLREDLEFIGYEFVPHRVKISQKAAEDLGLQKNLQFEVQDLSLESFQIPKADIFYLYDPFTYETYEFVLKQIVELSQSQKLTIITKGNARSWLEDVAKVNGWPKATVIDEGNLCIFKNFL